MTPGLIQKVRRELVSLADPVRAPQMQAYMKSTMPYQGVPAPLVKKACRKLFADITWKNEKKWQADALGLWHAAKYREERYCVLHMAAHKQAVPFQTPRALPTYEELIVTGAWWDFVDDLAIQKIEPILAAFPAVMSKKMLAWSRDKNIWKRRASIICQIKQKERTDLELLYACIEPSLTSNEFFLRKGIGWALRQIAWHDPSEVIRYVKEKKDALSPLSKREALKNVILSGRIKRIP